MVSVDNNLKSLYIDGKPVRKASLGGKVFFEKMEAEGHLIFNGQTFTTSSSSSGFTGSDIVIDWGDGSTTNYVDKNSLNHTYATEGEYAITLIGNITSLGEGCFYDCSGLTSVVIPDSVTSLGAGCFASCSMLTSVVIPDSVTSLGGLCFSDCSSLTSVVIPDSVTSLGAGCFASCSMLTSVVLNWETDIPTYDSTWFRDSPISELSIPEGTLQDYIDAGYPSDKLVERGGE